MGIVRYFTTGRAVAVVWKRLSNAIDCKAKQKRLKSDWWEFILRESAGKPKGDIGMPVPVLGEGGTRDRHSIPLATKLGNHIPNTRRSEQLPSRMVAARQMWTKRFPDIRVRSLSSTYNCVGLVFAARRTWVDPSEVPSIFRDDGYRKVDGPMIGDVAVYRCRGEIAHVAFVIDVRVDRPTGPRNTILLSQWGHDGEYIHSERDFPGEMFGLESWREFEVEYWSERRHL